MSKCSKTDIFVQNRTANNEASKTGSQLPDVNRSLNSMLIFTIISRCLSGHIFENSGKIGETFKAGLTRDLTKRKIRCKY